MGISRHEVAGGINDREVTVLTDRIHGLQSG
jgi:hypothetical protein